MDRRKKLSDAAKRKIDFVYKIFSRYERLNDEQENFMQICRKIKNKEPYTYKDVIFLKAVAEKLSAEEQIKKIRNELASKAKREERKKINHRKFALGGFWLAANTLSETVANENIPTFLEFLARYLLSLLRIDDDDVYRDVASKYAQLFKVQTQGDNKYKLHIGLEELHIQFTANDDKICIKIGNNTINMPKDEKTINRLENIFLKIYL